MNNIVFVPGMQIIIVESQVTRDEQWGTTGTTGVSIVGGVLTVVGGRIIFSDSIHLLFSTAGALVVVTV